MQQMTDDDETESQNEKTDVATESQNKKTCFNVDFQYCQSRITGLNRIWSLKSLTMFKCESSYVLVYMQYNIRDSQALL